MCHACSPAEIPSSGGKTVANNLLHTQITIALQMVRQARFDGDLDIIDAAEAHLDLLDRLLEAVPA